MEKNEFVAQSRKMFLEFKDNVGEELENYAISTQPYIKTFCFGAFSEGMKLYQKKRVLNESFITISAKILLVSKQLFEDFVLDLGVKHPKS